MFKKFLVLCVMMCFTALWGEVDVLSSGSVLVQEKDICENKSIQELEKEALKDQVKALNLSLYYQGFAKHKGSDIYTSELYENNEIIDFEKALYWANAAFDLGRPREQYIFNLFKLESLLPDSKIKKSHFYSLESKEFVEEILAEKKGNKQSHFPHNHIYSYMYFNGIGVEKDIEKAKKLLEFDIDIFAWKNFFIGKFAPKDVEFAKFILECGKERYLSFSYCLYLIYNGEFSPLYVDKDKASYFLDFYENTKTTCAEGFSNSTKKEIDKLEKMLEEEDSKKINLILAAIYLKKYSYALMSLDENIFIINPHFDLKKGEAYLAKVHKTAFSRSRAMIIFLGIYYNIKDSKAILDKCLCDDTFSLKEKEKLKEAFQYAYNKTKSDLKAPEYLDTFKPTDLESL